MKELLNSKIGKISTIILMGIGIVCFYILFCKGLTNNYLGRYIFTPITSFPIDFMATILPENYINKEFGRIIFYISIFPIIILLILLYKFIIKTNLHSYLKQTITIFILYQLIRGFIFVYVCLTSNSLPPILIANFLLPLLLFGIGIVPIIFTYDLIKVIKNKKHNISLSVISFTLYVMIFFV